MYLDANFKAMQTLSEAFAVVLKERREKQSLSQETLAERAGLHRTYVGLIERGLRKPTLDVARALADGIQRMMASDRTEEFASYSSIARARYDVTRTASELYSVYRNAMHCD